VTVVGLTRGAGVGTSGTAASGGWGGNGFDSPSAVAAIAAQDFATFSLTASNGYTMSFTNISRFDYRRSTTGPPNGVLQYQIGSGSFVDIANLSYPTIGSGDSLGSINLSAIGALQNVPAGTNVTFRIVSYGGSSPTGTWYIYNTANNTAVDFSIAGSLNPVVALVPPTISVPPQNQTANQGDDTMFTVTATGTPPLGYQWRFNSTAPVGNNASNYTRVNVQPADVGGYSVVITNAVGSITSAVANLTLQIPAPFLTIVSPGLLQWDGLSNLTYTVQSRTNLTSTNWPALGTAASPSNTIWFTNSADADEVRIFRVTYP
jgi:hypothetical protein